LPGLSDEAGRQFQIVLGWSQRLEELVKQLKIDEPIPPPGPLP